MSNKSVFGVLEGILDIPSENRALASRLMSYFSTIEEGSIQFLKDDASRESLFKCVDSINELSQDDKNEVLRILSRHGYTVECEAKFNTKFNKAAKSSNDSNESNDHGANWATIDLNESEDENPINDLGMMEKARRFIGGLPSGAKVTPISVCKRAKIDPANMYQLCRSLANEGLLEKISFAKYKVVSGSHRTSAANGGNSMRLAEELASMSPRPKRAISTKTSPKAYIEALPKNKVFKLKNVKLATGKKWNSVTATAWQLAHNGVIKRKAKGVYVRV